MKLRLLALGLASLALGCATPAKTTSPKSAVPDATAPSLERGIASAELSRWVADYHRARYTQWPRRSPAREHRGQLESVSAKSFSQYEDALRAIGKGLETLDPKAFNEQDRISYDMLRASIQTQLALAEHQPHQIPFNSDSGFFSALPGMHMQLSFDRVEDYEAYLSILEQVPRYIDEQVQNMRDGAKRGFTAPLGALPAALSSIRAEKDRAPEASPFYQPFSSIPTTWPEEQQKALRVKATAVIKDKILPAYRSLYDFLDKEYRPFARKSAGVWSLPSGAAYYQALVAHHTDGDLSAVEIHEIGLQEVRRIEAEMKTIRDSIQFRGDAKAFLEFLRTDPQFYAKSPRELLMVASYISKRIDAQVLKYFHSVPPRPYGVFPVPDAIAPYYTVGRYAPAGAQTRDPGQYWVNTHKLESRPLYALPALTAHEAVPGHHLQISRHQAMKDLPHFRRESGSTAYIEGWALYSERLVKDMGIYETPYEDFGRLNYEMWRACRLVVDTGIHAMQWTRAHAIEFMLEHTALSQHEIETEVDRYISWPAQALSYKMGEIEIRKLLREAKTEMGERFDLRDFHEVILEAGPVPLSTLRQRVHRWIKAGKNESPTTPVGRTS